MNQAKAPSNLYQRLKKIFLIEFVEAIVAALVVAALLRFFVVSVYRVPTESMMPTLIPGEFIVAWKTSYGVKIPFLNEPIGLRAPERGDVVVFTLPGESAMYVKRVIAIPGDRIEIRDGSVILNDVPTSTPSVTSTDEWKVSVETNGRSTHRVMSRAKADDADFLAPQIVPPGHVFLMGDLRSNSFDSRHWGPVPFSQIVARAAFIGLSLEVDGYEAEKPLGLRADSSLTPSGRVRYRRLLERIE